MLPVNFIWHCRKMTSLITKILSETYKAKLTSCGYVWHMQKVGAKKAGKYSCHFCFCEGWSDLWTFRDLDFSRVVHSRPMIGPFATRYFSHLFDPSRFATSVIFAVCRQLTVNYSLTTSCIQ